MMPAAEMHAAETVAMATAMSVATTVAATMTSSVAAATGDGVTRQRHRNDHDCNSDCPSDHGVSLRAPHILRHKTDAGRTKKFPPRPLCADAGESCAA
jgi:hypothetical protein